MLSVGPIFILFYFILFYFIYFLPFLVIICTFNLYLYLCICLFFSVNISSKCYVYIVMFLTSLIKTQFKKKKKNIFLFTLIFLIFFICHMSHISLCLIDKLIKYTTLLARNIVSCGVNDATAKLF